MSSNLAILAKRNRALGKWKDVISGDCRKKLLELTNLYKSQQKDEYYNVMSPDKSKLFRFIKDFPDPKEVKVIFVINDFSMRNSGTPWVESQPDEKKMSDQLSAFYKNIERFEYPPEYIEEDRCPVRDKSLKYLMKQGVMFLNIAGMINSSTGEIYYRDFREFIRLLISSLTRFTNIILVTVGEEAEKVAYTNDLSDEPSYGETSLHLYMDDPSTTLFMATNIFNNINKELLNMDMMGHTIEWMETIHDPEGYDEYIKRYSH